MEKMSEKFILSKRHKERIKGSPNATLNSSKANNFTIVFQPLILLMFYTITLAVA